MRRKACLFATVLFAIAPTFAAEAARPARPAADTSAPTLWQEMYYWDALLLARDRSARGASDPNTVPVMKAIAGQIAQQVANLRQIDVYMKAQTGNLAYAFAQDDPDASLATIQNNFATLTAGCDQVRQNLFYLTSRERMAASQVLPDQEMYQAGLLVLGQIQQLQLTLNAVYYDAVAVRASVHDNDWATDKFFRFRADGVLRSVVRVQDSVFAVYNAGYDMTMRCR